MPWWIIAPPRSVGAWSKSGKDGKIARITRRVGYGGVFILMGREHPRVVTAAAKTRGEGNRKRRAAGDRLAGCGTLYWIK